MKAIRIWKRWKSIFEHTPYAAFGGIPYIRTSSARLVAPGHSADGLDDGAGQTEFSAVLYMAGLPGAVLLASCHAMIEFF